MAGLYKVSAFVEVSSDREQYKDARSFNYGYRDFPNKEGEARP